MRRVLKPSKSLRPVGVRSSTALSPSRTVAASSAGSNDSTTAYPSRCRSLRTRLTNAWSGSAVTVIVRPYAVRDAASMVVEQVAPGVWRAGTRFVNWYAVDAGGEGVTLIDAGLPGYRQDLDRTLREIGRARTDVRALILTHGHIDHIGFAGEIRSAGATVHLHPADAGLAAKPSTNT